MKKLFSLIMLFIVVSLFSIVRQARVKANQTEPVTAPQPPTLSTAGLQDTQTGVAPPVRSTRRISIPYGFVAPLLMSADGREVFVVGPGGCTEGEQVTIDVEITQASTGATATGRAEQMCTGDKQFWTTTAVADTVYLAEGTAEACGLATTSSGGEPTDDFEWCRNVTLLIRASSIHVPIVRNE